MKWTLDAKEVKISKDKTFISFKDFLLKLKPQDRPWVELKGKRGDYDKNSGEINLHGDLQAHTDNGYRIITDHILYKEKEGYFKVYGRTKDLINRGGLKIYPYELESLIIQHPKIEQVCIVATPNPVLGESICVCAVLIKDEHLTLKELRNFLGEKIAPHKLPDELSIMDEFPRLSGGVKINKFGKNGLVALAQKDENRDRYRK